MAESAKTAGVGLDLQALHACGADCGGDKADAWLAYRPGRRASHAGSIYDRVRTLHARLGRRVAVEDLAEAGDEQEQTAEIRRRHVALEQRRIAATPPTLPPGPAPVTVTPPLLARVRQARANKAPSRAAVKSKPPLKHCRTPRRRQYGATPTVSTNTETLAAQRLKTLAALLRQWGTA